MSKQANKTIIGAFVVGAVALVIIGIMIFGSGRFLSERNKYVLFFWGSVKGLNVGAPVSFRGVKVGQVTDIQARVDPKDYSIRIAVYIETDPGRFFVEREEEPFSPISHGFEKEKLIKELVDKQGLRAQLQMQSLLTGLLEVGFDFYPETPIKLLGIDNKYPELPTIPSDMEKLQMTVSNAIAKFEKMPINELVQKLVEAVDGIKKVTNAPEIIQTLRTLDKTLQNVQLLVQNLDGRVGPLASSIDESFKAARAALEQAQKTLTATEGVIGDVSLVRYQVGEALEQISDAARSLRMTAEYIDQHPEALIRGKDDTGGK